MLIRVAQTGCIDSFEKAGTILIGEMAHVLAHAKKGPRASTENYNRIDRYENLILLCPNHHTIVDKAPEDFPAELLRNWKSTLEDRVDRALDIPTFTTKEELFKYAHSLLDQNKLIHYHFGPTSETARTKPLSSLHKIWEARKIEEIIPNNSLIVAAFRRYTGLLNAHELQTFGKFEAHAIGFAANAEDRHDSVPMFPLEFAEMTAQVED